MIIDTHCHYNLEPLCADSDKYLRAALEKQVVGAIVVGTSLETSEKAIELSIKHPTLFASVGIHPEVVAETLAEKKEYTYDTVIEQTNALESLIIAAKTESADSKIIAIGEIGLDYYRLKSKGQKREQISLLQKQLCISQIELAWKHDLPAIFHIRDQKDRVENTAYLDLIEILQEKAAKKELPLIILHCISGTQEFVTTALQLGAYIGVAGNSTYDSAEDLRALIKNTPPDRVLLETDAPFLPPLSVEKADFCEPHMITQTAAFLQQYSDHNLATILANTLRIFPMMQKVLQHS